MTLAEAADGIVSRQALQQFEAGKARPMPATLQAIARRLRVSVDTLLARSRDPREVTMRELEEKQRWRDLERVAAATIADLNITARTKAVARFYLGRAILYVDPDEALGHLRRARGELAKLGEPWLAAEARDWESAALYLMEDAEALDAGRDALARYRALTDRDPTVEARMLEHIGSYLLHRQEVAEALGSYRQAIDVAGSVLNLERLANIYHGLGSGCLRVGESRQALDYFDRAVHFSRTAHDVRGEISPNLARLENDFGDLLIRTSRWERGEEMITAALEHFADSGVEAGRSYALLSMGDLRARQEKVDEALTWTHEAIELAERLGETVSLALGYQQLGELSAARGEEEQFESSFSRAFRILAELPERRAECLTRYRRVRDARTEQQLSS